MDDSSHEGQAHRKSARTGRAAGSAGKSPRVRRSGPERQAQIAAAVLRLMARDGLQSTTVSRIAEEVGMEAPSLYAHFPSRHDMLLAATELLFERASQHLSLANDTKDTLEGLRTMCENHATFITEEFDGFVIPVFEIMTAPRDSGLSDALGRQQRRTLDTLAAYVEEGKRQGVVREDMDSRMAAYEMMVLFWAEDVTQLMGIDEFVSAGISKKILDLFLLDMAASKECTSGKHSDSEYPSRPRCRAIQAGERVTSGSPQV